MKMRKFILALLILTTAGTVFGQTKRAVRKSTGKATTAKTASAKKATPKAVGAWITFNGGEFVRKIAVDSKNVYVTMMDTKRMVVIDKKSGKLQEVKAGHDISSVAVAADKCYYYVDREGIFSYDAATGTSEGPLFGITPPDWKSPKQLYTSPDGRFLLCGDALIALSEGRVISEPGEGEAINNLGGVYIGNGEEWYAPLLKERYQVTPLGTAVRQIYPDTVSGNVYCCTAQGLGMTPMVPQPREGLKSIPTNFETDYNLAMFLTRDDEGNFVVSTNSEGIGFGGKSIEDPYRMEKDIPTGIKNEWNYEIKFSGSREMIYPDGQGNLIFASDSSGRVFIYNPKGLNGYAELKGKSVQFED